MRGMFIALLIVGLSSCCTPPQREQAPPAPAAETPPPELEPKAEPVAMPTTMEEAVMEGFLVCRREGDVRIVGIREVKDGKCLLVYDNRLSGSGTQNVLPNRDACELQQLRMKQNFVRSGFVCE